MLHLAEETQPGWLERAIAGIDEVLLDHAHAEKKAAAAAVGMLFRYPDKPGLLAPLAALAREELGHFEQLLAALSARGQAFRAQRPSPYAGSLHALVRPTEPERLLDTLLVSALIEARSCERFQLLGAALDEPLGALYRDLVASEARHHGLYLELARQVADPDAVAGRLDALAEAEARILADSPPWPRLHT